MSPPPALPNRGRLFHAFERAEQRRWRRFRTYLYSHDPADLTMFAQAQDVCWRLREALRMVP